MEHLEKYNVRCLSVSALKVIAMVLMLCDHLWATIVPGNLWMTCVGRLAFPIFAFQVVEGYFCTHDFRAYLKRLVLFALISEIPFNLMAGGYWLHPFHQNVMFTFVLSLLILRKVDQAKQKGIGWYALTLLLWSTIGYLLGTALFVDYYGYGVLIVLLFYVTRGVPYGRLLQLLGMIFINCELMKGQFIPVELGGKTLELSIQGLAVLALIPIWMYNGEKGKHGALIQKICYVFYPAHILVLSVVGLFLL